MKKQPKPVELPESDLFAEQIKATLWGEQQVSIKRKRSKPVDALPDDAFAEQIKDVLRGPL